MPKIVEDEKVFQAALRVVVKRGYARATTKQIAEAAEVSEVTLFRKYGSKAELIRRAIALLAEETDLARAARYTGDVAADLLRVTQRYQGSAQENGLFFYSMFLEISRHPELSEVIETPLHMMQGVARLLERYQAEGVLKTEPPLHAVAALLGPLMVTNMIRSVSTAVSLPRIDLANHVSSFLDGRRLNRTVSS